jgi:hypothetical protein
MGHQVNSPANRRAVSDQDAREADEEHFDLAAALFGADVPAKPNVARLTDHNYPERPHESGLLRRKQ